VIFCREYVRVDSLTFLLSEENWVNRTDIAFLFVLLFTKFLITMNSRVLFLLYSVKPLSSEKLLNRLAPPESQNWKLGEYCIARRLCRRHRSPADEERLSTDHLNE
jgi:hypothetical protein